jgi:hypothetical protein
MITHRSCLEALAIPHAADAFDFLADLWLLPYNATQKAERVGLGHHLETWYDYAVDLGFMLMDNYRLPSGMMPDDGRIAGVTERAVQETMDL